MQWPKSSIFTNESENTKKVIKLQNNAKKYRNKTNPNKTGGNNQREITTTATKETGKQ